MEPFIEDKVLQEMTAFLQPFRNWPGEIVLGPGETVRDLGAFIASHLMIMQPGNSLTVQRPAWERLLKARAKLEGTIGTSIK
jgi:hypothetical protein